MPHSTWNLPGPGIEPVSPEVEDRFLTTGPPGRSVCHAFCFCYSFDLQKKKKKDLVSSLKPPRYLIEEPVILGLVVWG